ncbi:hypothetical protein SAMD00019534_117840 [Acytostelium subglobosum LB1]|uniref:hypothetical protein n=1 Tax=Acytostelium subglobosum LB1 TaxID=1410327 RepID=UPI000644DAA0|nr:hypothetical protein SAMD00019534_117840 [Acytostelium subglobosum LB1]GAM28608.1 hypothetical protein SAMD00019534_117840 [Acytostelium subglobosum LB1]|eukprot:XP_012748386.1 hypothetical protein SAMD00019534_117840 [Acytostelium subglobosum LB1]
MFKKVLDSAKASIVELVEEPEDINVARAQIKNMKWSIKLLIENSKNYCLFGDKSFQQATALANIMGRFGEKTSHTNYISNQTVPLSVSLMEVGSCVKDSALLFQQYNIGFYDRLHNQLMAIYAGNVKKVIATETQHDDMRSKFSAAVYNLKHAQKSGKQVSEKQAEHDTQKMLYDQSCANLLSQVHEMVRFVQREVAVALRQFVVEQKRFIDEGIRMWMAAEGKIFGVESPTFSSQHSGLEPPQPYQPPITLDKMTIEEQDHHEPAPFEPVPETYEQMHQSAGVQHQETYLPPTHEPNPFDDANPFET